MADRWEFSAGPGQLRNGLIVSAFLAAVGLWTLLLADSSLPGRELSGAVLLAIAVGFAAWVLHKAGRRQPVLILDSDGIAFKNWGDLRIPWPAIGKIYARGGRLRRFLCIELEDSDSFLATLSAEDRKALERSTLVRLPTLFIPYAATNAGPEEIFDIMERLQATATMRSRRGETPKVAR